MEGPATLGAPDRAAPPASADPRLAELATLIDSGAFDVLSLDVFDTFVHRDCPRPTDVFFHAAVLVRERGLLHASSSPESFVRERIEAERRARRAKPGHEPTLAEIWAEFPRGYFRRGGPDDGLRAELECERRVVRVHAPMRALAERARARGMKVAFVSDTYFVRRQILQLTGWEPDELVLSCEHARPKARGLHGVLLERCRVPAERVLHVGDSREADVDGPERLGIARFWLRKLPADFEDLIERELPDALSARAPLVASPDGGLTSVRAQAMAAGADTAERWGAGVLGPVLAGYAGWVRARCDELGIGTVLCLMREGRAIRRALQASGAPLRAHEAFVSRYVALKASIVEGRADEIARFVLRPTPQRLGRILSQLGLEPADLPGADPGTLLTAGQARTFVAQLAADARVRAKLVRDSARVRAALLAHLAPLLPARGRVAIADLGYKGTIQMGLQRAFDAERLALTTHGLYLVTGGDVHETQSTGASVEGWLAENGQPMAIAHTFMRSPEVFEQGLMADCGTTLGHGPDGTPVLDEPRVPAEQRAGITAIQRGADRFLAAWAERTSAGDAIDATTMHALCRAVVVRAIARPLPAELALFGRWRHDENFGDEGTRTLVTADDLHEWERSHLTAHQLASLPHARLHWPFAYAWGVSDALGEAVADIFLRQAPPWAFDSALGTRPLVVSWNDGSGWSDARSAVTTCAPGSHGRCWHRASLALERETLRAVAFGLGRPGDLVRVTGARLHWVAPDGAVTTETRPLDTLIVHGADAIAPGVFATGAQALMVLADLGERPAFTGTVHLDLFFSLLPGA
ncbi:MAG TPA: hypothetical protein VMH61_01975 [Candidatus Acidoferrales bacterium]|nr:hypothetical protein [Candidatus Acidoferrales bacterium]